MVRGHHQDSSGRTVRRFQTTYYSVKLTQVQVNKYVYECPSRANILNQRIDSKAIEDVITYVDDWNYPYIKAFGLSWFYESHTICYQATALICT